MSAWMKRHSSRDTSPRVFEAVRKAADEAKRSATAVRDGISSSVEGISHGVRDSVEGLSHGFEHLGPFSPGPAPRNPAQFSRSVRSPGRDRIETISSTSSTFITAGGIELNVEEFVPPSGLGVATLIHYHGICESAETVAVQRVAHAACQAGWRCLVLEFEGHGLSSGQRAVLGSFSRVVAQAVEHVKWEQSEGMSCFALSGHSFGGAVALYVAEHFAPGPGLLGVALVSPAVGCNDSALPSTPVVGALRMVSHMTPGLASNSTPLEDPTHYAHPPNSTRNYAGHWPLATSRMLYDLTTDRVVRDLARRKFELQTGRSFTMGLSHPLLVVGASDDPLVPYSALEDIVKVATAPNTRLVPVDTRKEGVACNEPGPHKFGAPSHHRPGLASPTRSPPPPSHSGSAAAPPPSPCPHRHCSYPQASFSTTS